MRRYALPFLFLLALTILLLLSPADRAERLRLAWWDLTGRIFGPVLSAGRERATDPSAAMRELRDRLRQKDLEIASLRLRLSQLGAAREYLPQLQVLPANVLVLNRAEGGSLIVDQGEGSGVGAGAGVLRGQTLVGTVTAVGERTALVRPLFSPGNLTPGVVNPQRDTPGREPPPELCSVVGDGETAKAVFYGEASAARRGDTVLTSGLLGELPAGLVIGELAADPDSGSEPNTLEAPLKLRGEPYAWEGVLIIRRQLEKIPEGGGSQPAAPVRPAPASRPAPAPAPALPPAVG